MSIDSQQFGKTVQKVDDLCDLMKTHVEESNKRHEDSETRLKLLEDFTKEFKTFVKVFKFAFPIAIAIWPVLSFILKLVAIVHGDKTVADLITYVSPIHL